MRVYPNITNKDKFNQWFENSKGVNSNNAPQVYYHKSRSKEAFCEFEYDNVKKSISYDCYGFYFVADYHKTHIEYIADGLEFYVYLKIIKPFIVIDNGVGTTTDVEGNIIPVLHINKAFCERLKELGYDSIIIKCLRHYDQYIVFDGGQIKSVLNNGEFSKETKNINL